MLDGVEKPRADGGEDRLSLLENEDDCRLSDMASAMAVTRNVLVLL
jgi:hypothetical protein